MAAKAFILIKTVAARIKKVVAALKQLGGLTRRGWKVYAKAYKKLKGAGNGGI